MARRLYIGNLPYKSCTEDALRALFSPRNVVEIKVVNDRETHRPKGFCFVEFATDGEAAEVIEKFNGMTVDGRQIVVNEARAPQNSGGGDRRNNRPRRDDRSGW